MDENNNIMDDPNVNGNSDENTDRILGVNIEDEMQKSYINYAMSVIVSRALPDVRDGLKPVHRRVLYSMNQMNLDPTKGYKKSARIVGDTMGKYHPHGESSIYNTLVRMAQDFSLRYMLVDGHGNFGSIDGDGAAAQRYTEARLSRISMEMLADIEKNTVDFVPNYDEEDVEPTVLPARFPNLLVNGSSGIAVGMATNIPPHNLTEVIDGVLLMIDNFVENNRETEIAELIRIIKGPDFPTGATILGTSGIKSAYLTGRGKVTVRANAEIQTMANGKEMIVVTEIPYQVNKSVMIEKIADLVKEKRIDGITDLRDESDRNGIRVVIEVRKDANANVILNNLYKFSQLQETFGINMLALVDNEPKVLNLKEILNEYLRHQKEVVTRRTQFDLEKALKRAHIVEGFLKALDFIDEIIAIIRSNREIAVSKEIIMERFGFTKEQADAIAEMRLRNLSGLEREKLEKEMEDLKNLIDKLNLILSSEIELYKTIKTELTAIRDKFGDERRTQIVHFEGEIDFEDLIDESVCVVAMTHFDYVKRTPLDTYRSQNRGGRGVVGMTTRDEDLVRDIFITSTHTDVLFFTSFGKVYKLRAYEIPEVGRTARGTAIVNLLNLDSGEKIAAVIPVDSYESGYMTMVTKNGLVKKTDVKAYSRINKSGLIAINIREEDELVNAMLTSGFDDVFIATRNGMGIKFSEKGIRAVGRNSMGVKGIKLSENDYIIGAENIGANYNADETEADTEISADESETDNENEIETVEYDESDIDALKILFVSENGYGKKTPVDEFRIQGRSGKGLKAYKVTEKTGKLKGISVVNDKDELMIINSEGIIIRIRIEDISTMGRITQGVKLINLNEGSKVISIAKIAQDQLSENDDDEEDTTEENSENENEE